MTPSPSSAGPTSASSAAASSSALVALQPTADGSRSRCIAQINLPVGTLVLAGEPTAAVLLDEEKGRRCDHCLRVLPGKPLRCSRCLEDAYCSQACQADAWKRHHRVLCKVLVALSHRLGSVKDGGRGVTDVERLDAVLLARLAVEHFKTAQEGVSWDAEVIEDALDLPQSQLVLSLMAAPATTLASPIPALVASLLPAHIDEQMLKGIYARFQRNNHVLVAPDAALRPFANAVLARVSRAINHSCLPSGVVVTTWVEGQPQVGVRTIRALAAGEEVTISYLDPLLARSTRKKSLQALYGFTCMCLSCVTPLSRAAAPRLPPIPKAFPSLPGRPSMEQLQLALPPYPANRLPAAAPTGLSEAAVSRKTIEYEDAHAEGRWSDAGVAGEHVLEIYWAAYGPYTPLIGTHLLSLGAVHLNASIVLPARSPEAHQALCRATLFANWARAVLELIWGRNQEVDDALSPLENALRTELSAI